MAEVKEISVNVSKKIGLKNFSSAMLSASITMSVDESVEKGDTKEAYNEAWAIAWEELNAQEKKFKEEQEMAEAVETPEPQTVKPDDPDFGSQTSIPGSVEDNVICQVHHVKMTHFVKPDGDWWSHKLENGKWCNGRDTKYNREL